MADKNKNPGIALIGMGTEILVLLAAGIYAGRYAARAMEKPETFGILIGALLALVIWVYRVIQGGKLVPREEIPIKQHLPEEISPEEIEKLLSEENLSSFDDSSKSSGNSDRS